MHNIFHLLHLSLSVSLIQNFNMDYVPFLLNETMKYYIFTKYYILSQCTHFGVVCANDNILDRC